MFLISSSQAFLKSIAPGRAARRFAEMLGVVLVCCLASTLFPVERVTWENLERIRVGMTGREARDVLVRMPDGEMETRGRVVNSKTFLWGPSPGSKVESPADYRDYHVTYWESPGLTIVVVLDEADRVRCRFTGTGQVREDGLIRFLRANVPWLGRLL